MTGTSRPTHPARHPVHYRATPARHGSIRYDLPGAGTVTLRPYSGDYPQPGVHRLELITHGHLTVHRVPLAGAPVVDPIEALACHHETHPTWIPSHWLRLRRADTHAPPPPATQARAAIIVAALIVDYLHRPDLAALLDEHARAHAPDRIRHHQRAIWDILAEIQDRTTRLERERDLLRHQQALTSPPLHAQNMHSAPR